ncbi:MAG TPA: FtsX-like permease family protein [Solirubrobacterales bacterium]|nr:FtsX-like permease family protein [Solirubrobacterales bacterium]
MRSFDSLAFRQVRARKLRALLTAAGIVLGVGMIVGVLVLAATIQRTFTDLFDSVYGKTDLVVSGTDQTSLPHSTLGTVRATREVADAEGRISTVFGVVDRFGRAAQDASSQVNVAGEDPEATNLTDAETVAGRRPRRGGEIMLQESWAEAQELDVGERVRLATPSGLARLRVVGLFQFATGLDFGGQGFGTLALGEARELMEKRRAFDEVNVVVDGGEDTIARVQDRLRDELGKGVRVLTPSAKSDEVEAQLQAFNAILYFFAAMALFVGGFLIFNSFNMTVFQRMREIGMLRTLGATRGMVTRSVLTEAALLGLVGVALGVGLGMLLALGLIWLMREVLEFPVGELRFTWLAPAAAVVTGLGTALLGALYPARRAGRTSPIRAVLGGEGLRSRPRPRRAALGAGLIVAGLAGAFWLGAADETTPIVAAAGMAGTVAIFFGIALVAPFAVVPMVGVLSWPVRRLAPVEGRIAADSARSDPSRTAATATGLMIGLALVVAVNSLGSSFLSSISEEFDRSFARDLTVQPTGFSPGEGPQQTIAGDLRDRLARIPEADVVARERILFVPDLPGPKGKTETDGLLLAFQPEQYEQVDTTDIEGAPRDQVFERLERGWVTVGEGHADEQGLEVGDRIELDGPSGSRSARVAGIVETVIFGGQTVGMSLETLRAVYGVTADSELALKASSDEARPVLEREVERIVERDHPNLSVLSNEELKSDVEDQVNEQFGIFYAIVGVAVFVSLFGIVNTLSMSVIERTREIGVLRALGSTRWQVRRQIGDESLVIGLIGALLGIAVGAVLGWALLEGLSSGIPGVEYRPPLTTMAWVAVAGIVLGLIASIVPARRAARLDVIRALSYE